MSDAFKATHRTISGAPPIEFSFAGALAHASLNGAELACVIQSDGHISMRLVDAEGLLLADITLRRRAHRTDTENVMDIGGALLWSHHRYLEALKQAPERSAP